MAKIKRGKIFFDGESLIEYLCEILDKKKKLHYDSEILYELRKIEKTIVLIPTNQTFIAEKILSEL